MDELHTSADQIQRLLELIRGAFGPEVAFGEEGPIESVSSAAGLAEATISISSLGVAKSEIDSLDAENKRELVALMWIGRGDFSAPEWDAALSLADERHDAPTWKYLLSHPRVADQIASGLEEMGYAHFLSSPDT